MFPRVLSSLALVIWVSLPLHYFHHPRELHSPPKMLERRGQFLYLCCRLKKKKEKNPEEDRNHWCTKWQKLSWKNEYWIIEFLSHFQILCKMIWSTNSGDAWKKKKKNRRGRSSYAYIVVIILIIVYFKYSWITFFFLIKEPTVWPVTLPAHFIRSTDTLAFDIIKWSSWLM